MKDFKDEIAEKFIQAMEEGTAPWQKAWSGSQYTLRNGITGHEYSGLNVLRLCLNTYEDPRYCTFKQAKDKGWKIKKGSHGYIIRHVCFIEKTDENGEVLEGEKPIFCEKFFRVFNFEQVEGTPEFEEKEENLKKFEIIPACENVLKNAEILVKEDKKSNQAFYDVRRDSITVPNRERFVDELSFYRTVFHEIAHATGAETRLNRNFSYAHEELIAEISSFLIGRELGCGSEPSPSSLSYVASWIQALKNDKQYIFSAVREAKKATKWVLYPESRKGD